jgi:hypothetical protein
MPFGDQHKFSDEVKVNIGVGDAFHMNDFLQRLVNGIIRQEGMPEDYANPGNLRAAPWLTHPMINEHNFWVPISRKQGIAGLAHLAALHVAQGNSLVDFIAGHPGVYSGFAPGADNNKTDVYIQDLCDWVCIPDRTQPLWNWVL